MVKQPQGSHCSVWSSLGLADTMLPASHPMEQHPASAERWQKTSMPLMTPIRYHEPSSCNAANLFGSILHQKNPQCTERTCNLYKKLSFPTSQMVRDRACPCCPNTGGVPGAVEAQVKKQAPHPVLLLTFLQVTALQHLRATTQAQT